MSYKVGVSVAAGKNRTEEFTVETEEEAKKLLSNILQNLDVITWIEETEEEPIKDNVIYFPNKEKL
jgi:hypothetical protein